MNRLFLLLCALFFLLLPTAHSQPKSACTKPNTTELTYRGDGDHLDKIYKALLTCPNITSLDLDFVWSGCVAPSEPWAFLFQPGDRLPALKKLSLSDYDLEDSWRQSIWRQQRWGIRENAYYHWGLVKQFFKKLYHADYDELFWSPWPEMPKPKGNFNPTPLSLPYVLHCWPGCRSCVPSPYISRHPQFVDTDTPLESNLDKWLRTMDFSQIEELSLAQEEKIFYERMKNELPALKRLSLSWANSRASIPDERIEFIQSTPPLESLSIWIGAPYYYNKDMKNRTQFPLQAIRETHGRTLQILELQQSETNESNLRRPMLSVAEINDIASSCPQLQHLTVDIDRDASFGWPNTTLDAITQIPTLDSLKLRLELGADLHDFSENGAYGWNPQGLGGPAEWFREPRMDQDVAEALCQDLTAKKVGTQFKRVDFVVGDFEEKPYSGPIYFPSWVEGRARLFMCERDAEQKLKVAVRENADPFDFEW